MRPSLRRPSKPTVFAILMVGAALVALLPVPWTGCSGGVMQPLGWLAWAFSSSTRQARETAEDLTGPSPTREELEKLHRDNEELAWKLGHQQVEIAKLEQQVSDLSGLRDQLNGLPAKIIFASVVAGDAAPRRETLTISKGRRDGVRPGDWVAAGVRPAQRDPAATGRDLLLRQWLIGRVADVQPYLSRVQLATDAQFGTERAWAAKVLADGTWQVADSPCGLEGLGDGRMRVREASEDYLATGHTVVLVPLAHPRPTALAIGRIVASETLKTGLHYDLEVEPWGNPRTLWCVYVISLAR
jgi:cell shape-determining protein MreC